MSKPCAIGEYRPVCNGTGTQDAQCTRMLLGVDVYMVIASMRVLSLYVQEQRGVPPNSQTQAHNCVAIWANQEASPVNLLL